MDVECRLQIAENLVVDSNCVGYLEKCISEHGDFKKKGLSIMETQLVQVPYDGVWEDQ